MLMAGKNITQSADPLVKVTTEYLYHALINPKPDIESAIRQLRLVRNIDVKRYQVLKRELPYIVTGIFYPATRKTENFAWANHFMIDIDHLSEKDTTTEAVKEKLSADKRILLMFVSPGNDGIKILFRIDEKIVDSAQYSLFYKIFLQSFSKQYNLEQVTDTRTSDVTRACFMSHDPLAFWNPSADPVVVGNFVNFDNQYEIMLLQKEHIKTFTEKPQPKTEKTSLETDVLDKIKATLNPEMAKKREKQIFVPEEAERMVDTVVKYMIDKEITTIEVINIHYGKKFRFALNNRQAEINLFYGKRGFTAVISPRIGTNGELNEVCLQLINQLFG